ncbi:hypothetical protein Sjap_019919 [Stephania japonica]|uniref:Uncharacterized protein n=1 Tax=Stephania japonica TaxID=461633 RepID=A0AAP0F2E1_9MAGN
MSKECLQESKLEEEEVDMAKTVGTCGDAFSDFTLAFTTDPLKSKHDVLT